MRTPSTAAREAVEGKEYQCPDCVASRKFRTHDGRYLTVDEFIVYGRDQLKQIEERRFYDIQEEPK